MPHNADKSDAGDANPASTQSQFDLQLDRWSKMSTILIGFLGLLVTTYVTVWVVLPGDSRNALAVCQSNKFVAVQILRENPNIGIDSLATEISRLCDDLSFDASYQFLAEFRVDSEIASEVRLMSVEQTGGPEPSTQGFVSLGRVDDYQSSNFRFLDTGEKALKEAERLQPGVVLIARWSVNLRENSSNTEAGSNPILSVIQDENCVELTGKPELLRGSQWVEVKSAQCNEVEN